MRLHHAASSCVKKYRTQERSYALVQKILPTGVGTQTGLRVAVKRLSTGYIDGYTGKWGGARVIYFYHDDRRPLYLLLVYAKGRQENLTPDEKKAVRKLAALLKQ